MRRGPFLDALKHLNREPDFPANALGSLCHGILLLGSGQSRWEVRPSHRLAIMIIINSWSRQLLIITKRNVVAQQLGLRPWLACDWSPIFEPKSKRGRRSKRTSQHSQKHYAD